MAWALDRHVVWSADPYLLSPPQAPEVDCILVPGARIHPDGTPFHMLSDRLAMAQELFVQGRAPRVVVSGRGGGGVGVDEVAAMRRWLEARGVPAAAIVDDPDGLRTIDSVVALRERFGWRSAIVVSNDFHVPRMVFLARHLGLEAYGVAAPELVEYGAFTLWKNRGREVLARLRACVDVYL
ncbi:MAG: ElyC/SanA/YdcF family protein [Planctomycetota bacterium]